MVTLRTPGTRRVTVADIFNPTLADSLDVLVS
jgi:hypothetical protein